MTEKPLHEKKISELECKGIDGCQFHCSCYEPTVETLKQWAIAVVKKRQQEIDSYVEERFLQGKKPTKSEIMHHIVIKQFLIDKFELEEKDLV